MARLNQPPTTTNESIESLKRRFIRQNRELARCNSAQSIKIRALEDEITRLLAENISLRESNIDLHNELEEWSSEECIGLGSIQALKLGLEIKLRNLASELVAHVDSLDRKPIQRRKQRKNSRLSIVSDPDYISKQYKNRDRLSEILSLQGGMLPTIVEGKSYPRATLDTNELHSILFDQSSEVGDAVGKPTGESVFMDPQDSTSGEGKDGRTTFLLPQVNLESRRHRRESGVRMESSAAGKTSPSKELGITGQPLRAGSKRKLDDRAPESTPESEVSPIEALPTSDTQSTDSQDYSDIHYSNHRLDNATALLRQATSPARKALAPKSVNTDPLVTSPSKKTQGRKTGICKATREEPEICRGEKVASTTARANEPQRPKPTKKPFISTPKIVDVNIKVEPTTPGPDLELFSPPSTVHSSEICNVIARNGTPPPIDLASQEHAELGANRSRRARAAVSYAEPSLNTKLRRPGKELVDAIYPKGQRQSTGTVFEACVEHKDEVPAGCQTGKVKELLQPKLDDMTSSRLRDDRPHLQSADSPIHSKQHVGERAAGSKTLDVTTSSEGRLRSWIGSGSESEHNIDTTSLVSRLKEGRASRRTSNLKLDDGEEHPSDGQAEKIGVYDVAVTPPTSALKTVSSSLSGGMECENLAKTRLTIAAIADEKRKQQQRPQVNGVVRSKSSASLNAATRVSAPRSTSTASERRQTLASDNSTTGSILVEQKHGRSSSTSALSTTASSRRSVTKGVSDKAEGDEESSPTTNVSNATTRRRRTMMV